MIFNFLSLRFKQVQRTISEAGLLYSLLIWATIISIHPLIYQYITFKPQFASVIAGAVALSLISHHFSRKDFRLISLVSDNPYLLYFSEYLSLIFFVVIIFVFAKLAFISILLVLFAFLLSLIAPDKYSTSSDSEQKSFIPATYFEWISGVRKIKYFLLFLYINGLIFSFNVFVVPIVLFFITSIFTSLYTQGEPIQLLELYELSARQFLWKKLKSHTALFTIFCLPLIVIFLFFHIELWWVILILLLFSEFVIAFSILVKYTFYEPNQSSGGQIWITFTLLSFLIPFLAPIPLMLTFRFYKRSIANLNTYLYAYA